MGTGFEKLADLKSRNEKMDFKDKYFYAPFQIGRVTDSVAVVIDGQSLFQCSRALDANTALLPSSIERFSIDFKQLYNVLLANFPILKRVFYITTERLIPNENERTRFYSPLRGLLDWMKFHNYVVTTVPVETSEGETLRNKDQESLIDVEVTTALFRAADIADHVIFFGANKKYAAPLQMLFQEKGKTITVVSVHDLPGNRIVDDSLRQIGTFVDMVDRDFIRLVASENAVKRNFQPTVESVKDIA